MSKTSRGPRSLTLLHLSDIHLRAEEIDSPQDLDEDIRARLLRDVDRVGLPNGVDFDAVLVTGDVAFGGRRAEYDSASAWLRSLCTRVRCPEAQVWVVPGNHDVDREVITKSATIRDMHSVIRSAPDAAMAIAERLREDVGAKALLSPFAEYNRFAKQYRCETTVDAVFWESSDEDDDLILNDGSYSNCPLGHGPRRNLQWPQRCLTQQRPR